MNFSLLKQSFFTNLLRSDQSIIDISINSQQKHQKHVFLNAQSMILFQNQSTNQIQSIQIRFNAQNIRFEKNLNSSFQIN